MKQVLGFVLLFWTFSNLQAQADESKWQGKLQNGLREGKWLKYDSANKIQIEANYQKGKLQGRFLCWKDSVLLLEAFFDRGLRDSLWRYFYPNESLQLQAYFREGEPTNTWTEFFRNGKPAIEMVFSGGLKQGSFTHYFANGQKNIEMQYLTDLEEGNWTWQDSVGLPLLAGSFWDGNPESEWKSYQNSKTHWIFSFRDGKLDGEATEYYPDGEIRQKRAYEQDNLLSQSPISDPQDTKLPQGDFKDGTGEKYFYNSQNQLLAKANYKENRLNETAALFDSLGQKNMELAFQEDTLQMAKVFDSDHIQVFRFKNGQLTGLFEHFEQNQLVLSGFYHNNQKMGLWSIYENGILQSTSHYEQNKRNGAYKAFYPNGKPRTVGNYQHDLEEGLWQYFYPDSSLQQEETWERGKLWEIGLFYAPDQALLNAGEIRNGTGERLIYDEKGVLISQGTYSEGLPEGNWIFYENGKKYAEGEMKAGQKSGFWQFFYPNGKLKSKGMYENDLPVGNWQNYTKRGKKIK